MQTPTKTQALPKQESKVKETINAHYAYLDSSGRSGKHDDVIEDGLAHLVDKDYSPVVVFPIHSVS